MGADRTRPRCGGRSHETALWGPIELFLTLIAAVATALLLGLFAHDAVGMPIDTIRVERDISRTSILHISTYQRTSTFSSALRGTVVGGPVSFRGVRHFFSHRSCAQRFRIPPGWSLFRSLTSLPNCGSILLRAMLSLRQTLAFPRGDRMYCCAAAFVTQVPSPCAARHRRGLKFELASYELQGFQRSQP